MEAFGVDFDVVKGVLNKFSGGRIEEFFTNLVAHGNHPAGGVIEASASVADTAAEGCGTQIAEFTYDDKCKGLIDALMRVGYSEEEAMDIAEDMGMFKRVEEAADPHTAESAVMIEGDRVVRYENGVAVYRGDKLIAEYGDVDCDGKVTKYSGSFIDSHQCDGCPTTTTPSTVEEVAPVEPGPRIVTLDTNVRCDESGLCVIDKRTFLEFSSPEEARAFFADTEKAAKFFDELKDDGACVLIADGNGALQKIEFVLDDNGRPIMKDGVPVLSDKVELATFDDGKYKHMLETDYAREYRQGLGSPGGVRGDEVADVAKRDTPFVGAPEKLVYNSETGEYDYARSVDEQAALSTDSMYRAGGIDATEAALIKDMPLPAEFADPSADIEERGKALRDAAEARGVDMTKRESENLASIITEAQTKPVQISENGARILNVNAGGTMATLDQALFTTARMQTEGVRFAQGL